ncbi:hypothetical protein CHS0354_005134 [Potamilus streckersoni]|uniref:Uncharacterized protein n=1 Tax=Potamilus streckersoni TaxID=2493646 RepID=A0AAE0VWR9_9BIVA|nr:hypothetical protein CHS0354_005134 [Potamilus streckersoni]
MYTLRSVSVCSLDQCKRVVSECKEKVRFQISVSELSDCKEKLRFQISVSELSLNIRRSVIKEVSEEETEDQEDMCGGKRELEELGGNNISNGCLNSVPQWLRVIEDEIEEPHRPQE